MPALPDVPGVLRIDYDYTLGIDSTALNRHYVSYTGTAPTDASCVTIASDLFTNWGAVIMPYCVTANVLTKCTVTDLTTPSSGQGSYAGSVAGGLGGTPVGAGVALLGSMKIARRYRGGKPRTYLPMGDSGYLLNPQEWNTTFLGLAQAALNQIISDYAVTTVAGCSLGTLVNVSYYSGFTIRPSPPIAGVRAKNIPTVRTAAVVDAVTSWTAEAKLASQRRRNTRSA